MMLPRQSSTPESGRSSGQHQPRQHHLRGAEPEDVAPHLPQAARLQLQPDDEQQEDDAEFGDVQDLLAVRQPVKDRPDHHAGGEVAEHRAKPEPLENRGRDDGAAEQQDRFGKKGIGLGHA
jgi:hypothetical protein